MLPVSLTDVYECKKNVLDRRYLHFYFFQGDDKKHGIAMDNRKRVAYVMRSESMRAYGRIEP